MRALLHPIALALLLAGTCAADDPKDAARERAIRGIELFHEGRAEEAFEQLERAEAIHPAVTHRVYLARCEVAMGRLVNASARYRAIVAEERPADAPAPVIEAYATAAKELAALEERLPRLRIVAPALTAITLDGTPLEDALDAPVAIDPGEHRLVLERGATVREERFVAEEGKTTEIVLPDDEPLPSPEGDALVPAYVVFGVGGAALLAGAITGAISLSIVADVEERCIDGHCPPEDEDEARVASRLGTASTATLAIGGAAIATGIILVFALPASDRGAGVAPVVGPGYAGLRGRF